MILAIDSGTTNTRIMLVDKEIKDTLKVNAGARDKAITGSTDKLKFAIRDGINEVLKRNNLNQSDITKIVASGMIVSDNGLCPLAHISAPCSCEDLKKNSKTITMPDISQIPFTFIPGVKNNCTPKFIDDIDETDIMRGEETEAFGIKKLLNINDAFIALLPGSHTKIVLIDSNGKIVECATTLAGEMIGAIYSDTILKSSFSKGLPREYDSSFLKAGYDYSHKYGMTKALFRIRLMKMFLNSTPKELYGFFCGAILHDDIKMISEAVSKIKASTIVIGGSEPLRSIFNELLQNENISSQKLSDEIVNNCTAFGAIEILK